MYINLGNKYFNIIESKTKKTRFNTRRMQNVKLRDTINLLQETLDERLILDVRVISHLWTSFFSYCKLLYNICLPMLSTIQKKKCVAPCNTPAPCAKFTTGFLHTRFKSQVFIDNVGQLLCVSDHRKQRKIIR